jgi:hypothetical protein
VPIGLGLVWWAQLSALITLPLAFLALLPFAMMLMWAHLDDQPLPTRRGLRRSPRPVGVTHKRATAAATCLGWVRAGRQLAAPLTGRPCCAYAVSFEREDAEGRPAAVDRRPQRRVRDRPR